MTSYEVLVDPERLLIVRFVHPENRVEQRVVALTCAYVPATGVDGRTRIAIEIVVDPAMQNPGAPYYCDPERLAHFEQALN